MLVCRGTLADAQSGGPDHAGGADIAVADAAGRAVAAAQPAWRRRTAAGLGTLALDRRQPADWRAQRRARRGAGPARLPGRGAGAATDMGRRPASAAGTGRAGTAGVAARRAAAGQRGGWGLEPAGAGGPGRAPGLAARGVAGRSAAGAAAL